MSTSTQEKTAKHFKNFEDNMAADAQYAQNVVLTFAKALAEDAEAAQKDPGYRMRQADTANEQSVYLGVVRTIMASYERTKQYAPDPASLAKAVEETRQMILNDAMMNMCSVSTSVHTNEYYRLQVVAARSLESRCQRLLDRATAFA